MSGLTLPDGEPELGPWRAQAWPDVLRDLLAAARAKGASSTRPVIVAIDGRSGSGKTTAAQHLTASSPGSTIVHTDDVAWWQSCFDWDALMRTGVLAPVRRGEAVSFRPPAWEARGREGSIEVPAGTTLLVVEGVGSSRRSLAPLLDASVWVQSDYDEANRRGIARDATQGQGPDFWWDWMAQENPFLLDDRPWERADAVVCGTPSRVGGGAESAGGDGSGESVAGGSDAARAVLRGGTPPDPPRRA